ncbi:glycosyltransferase family 2 protein [Neobacillus sp. NPDC058068]|uniref:glycosyltransferase family 2 protein n=1 Tax=Neobacillus sp. NPDC058068 TaxID=3346325 RepID=UPI0036DCF0CE
MISIVTVTMRESMLELMMENFTRQNMPDKELIIILNKNDIRLEKPAASNIRVFQLDEAKTLGECLNFGARQARYEVIAKMDDDDYYSPAYLTNSLRLLKETGADVIGKAAIFVYFKKDKLLSIFRLRMTHFFLKNKKVFLAGGTLVFKKEVLENVQFPHLNSGEDVHFQQECLDKRIPLYSGGYHDYVLIRYGEEHEHSWRVSEERFQKQCKKVAVTDSFEKFV